MFCNQCGSEINDQAVVCPKCGAATKNFTASNQQPSINIVNENINNNTMHAGEPKNKWVAFFLCLFLGELGAHKFYEGKIGMGILYLFTCGLFMIGWLVDLIRLLGKPNPYYVYR